MPSPEIPTLAKFASASTTSKQITKVKMQAAM